MTSRRPMTRSYSGNGRSGSFNEEETSSSNGRSESRNNYFSNVRPENSYSSHRYSHYRPPRSAFCSVMSQLTEETQPSFETTVKSKAVSETCNVKFSCVVSGYPAPELTWYKDDVELDRYCGLPKYEVGRNGKIHTLQIYNCTVDDAAIYQASARNNKGIVSCSGVLEVGTMSEFKIHQRFFAKLKQKAEVKKREMEESRRRGKEPLRSSPDRSQRKRRSPGEVEHLSALEGEENAGSPRAEAVEQPAAAAVEPNGVSETPMTPTENGSQTLNHEMEIVTAKLPNKETLAKKKFKISNGVDAAHGNGGENSYDGGIGLAQFLAETLHSQAAEDKQSSAQVEKTMEMATTTAEVKTETEREKEREENERERILEVEREREKLKERELAIEREKERARQIEQVQRTSHTNTASEVKMEAKTHKEHPEHHKIQASLTSVLHSVKDFFFGKSKKGTSHHDLESSDEDNYPTVPTQTRHSPPQPRTQEPDRKADFYKPTTEETVPMEVDGPQEAPVIVVPYEQPVSLERLIPDEHNHRVTVLHTEELPPAPKRPPESVSASWEQKPVEVSQEVRSCGPETVSVLGPPAPSEEADDHTWRYPVTQEVASAPHEPNIQMFSSKSDQITRVADETQTLPNQGSSDSTWSPDPSRLAGPHTLVDTSMIDSGSAACSDVLPTVSQGLIKITVETEREQEMHVDKRGIESDHQTQETFSPDSEENGERGGVKETQLCLSLKESIEILDFTTQEQPTPILDDSFITKVSMSQENVDRVSSKTHVESTTVFEEIGEEKHFKNSEQSTPTLLPESSDNGEVKIPNECTLVAMESIEGHNFDTKERHTTALGGSGEKSVLKGLCTSALEEHLVDSSVCNMEIQEQVVSIVKESAGEKEVNLESNKVPTLTIEKEGTIEEMETEIMINVLDKSEIHSVTQPERGLPSVSQPIVSASVKSPEANTTHVAGFIENIPEIRIFDSTVEDLPEVRLIVSKQKLNEQIIIPKIETMEPEVKEPTMSLTLFTPNKPKSEPGIFPKDDVLDVTGIMITDNSVAVPPVMIVVTPTQESMQNDNIHPPTEKVQEVTQHDELTQTPNGKQPTEINNEWPTRIDSMSIPLINVSHTDDSELREIDLEHSHTKPLDTKPEEAPKVLLFVVPPISVICEEESHSETQKPPRNENTETESLVTILKGVKSDLENCTTIESDKTGSIQQKQSTEKQSVIVNTSSVPTEATTTTLLSSLEKTTEAISLTVTAKVKTLRESDIIADELQRDRPIIERLASKPPTPPRSPASLRRFMAKASPGSDTQGGMAVPAITVGDSAQSEKIGEEQSGGSTPTSSLSCESSPRMKRRDSLTLIRSATPEELASGARRKIFLSKAKGEEGEGVGVGVGTGAVVGVGALDTQVKKESPYMSPSQARRAAFLQAPAGQQTPPLERRSPLLSRRKATLEVPKVLEETPTEEPEAKPAEKEKLNPFKAPQVIRKIRGEPFPDASGHLKLWCQFFNVLSDSTIKWYRDEEEIVEVKRSGGDESQVALAIVQTSARDCGVYGCTIKNEYGTDTTDFLLSADILSEFFLREDSEVGEEIEMTPMLFTKGLADSGYLGDKFFGRIMTEEVHIGEGCRHKACRVKVIYGLDPVFESGSTCIIKVQSPIAYGTKEESNLAERNLEITKQECKIQNTVREYCKIFAAEARVIENFGSALEVNPLYMMYRPANSVPHSTVEADLKGVFLKYCLMDAKGRLITRTISEVEQKCCAFQHWIHQWTHGNLLVTQLEGVGMKITNVRVVTKSKGYQGLTDDGSPKVFEQFLTQHQCNYYCGLLSLRSLKTTDSLQQPPRIKGSRSPLLNRKLGSSSPQLQKKGVGSPQTTRKATSSPKVVRKTGETEDKSTAKPPEIPKVVS